MSEHHEQGIPVDPVAPQATIVTPPPPAHPEPAYFDALRHRRCQKLKNAGIKVDLGPLWNHVVMVMRPFSHPTVVSAQEAAEKQLRINLGWRADEKKELPTAEQIAANKIAVKKAIVGCAAGAIVPMPEQLAVARRHSFTIEPSPAGEVVVFTGQEDSDPVREFFWPLIEESHDFFLRLIAASQQIKEVRDEDLDPLGSDFVLGRHVALASLD